MRDAPHKQRSPAEMELVRTLAVAISLRLRQNFSREEGMGTGDDWCIYHLHTSDFEIACDTLWSLGVCSAAVSGQREDKHLLSRSAFEREGHRGFPAFFFIYTKEKVERLLKDQSGTSWPPTEEIIDAYLRIAEDYGRDKSALLPIPRGKPFLPTHPDQIAPLEALVTNGFAHKTGDQFIWADRMIPIMVKNWLWDETDVDWSSLDRTRILEQAQAVLTGLKPEGTAEIRRVLKMMSITFRGLEIMQRWTGSDWLPAGQDARFLSFDEAVAVSREIDAAL
ncbi:MAG: hypothetical protein AAFY24_18695 [Pseudomonadota bacterium]